MSNLMLDKMNKIYYARLKEYLTQKLGEKTEMSFKSDIDIKSELMGMVSIYSIMGDYILEASERKPDIEKFKTSMVKAIVKDAKNIIQFVNDNVNEYINEKGDKKAAEYKQTFINEVYNNLDIIRENESQFENEREI